MHLQTIGECNHYQSVSYRLASRDFCIHDVVECCIRPLSLFPVTQQLATAKQVDGGRDAEMYVTKGELDIKLSHSDLCGELSDGGREVEVFGYSIHLFQSNDPAQTPPPNQKRA